MSGHGEPSGEEKKLGLRDVTASTVANIGPGIDFYFAFGVIAVTAGIAAPLTIIASGIGVFFLAFIVAEFTRMEPSAGSFITSVPFLGMADHYLGDAAILAWLVGIISVLSTLVAAVNAQARVLFDGGRSCLLPSWLGESRPPGETPVNAALMMAIVGLGIVVIWWLCHVTGLVGGTNDPVNLYAECGTMGTILILFV